MGIRLLSGSLILLYLFVFLGLLLPAAVLGADIERLPLPALQGESSGDNRATDKENISVSCVEELPVATIRPVGDNSPVEEQSELATSVYCEPEWLSTRSERSMEGADSMYHAIGGVGPYRDNRVQDGMGMLSLELGWRPNNWFTMGFNYADTRVEHLLEWLWDHNCHYDDDIYCSDPLRSGNYGHSWTMRGELGPRIRLGKLWFRPTLSAGYQRTKLYASHPRYSKEMDWVQGHGIEFGYGDNWSLIYRNEETGQHSQKSWLVRVW
ncbi:hypothetical protein GCM10023333_28820 [Ferrimonas pelagia]|uniref:Uncharacterized protein n=2 Tax=Ferrimonas pelagia TaxID=1177826 RepID=A0ABP9F5Y8_9GAMM